MKGAGNKHRARGRVPSERSQAGLFCNRRHGRSDQTGIVQPRPTPPPPPKYMLYVQQGLPFPRHISNRSHATNPRTMPVSHATPGQPQARCAQVTGTPPPPPPRTSAKGGGSWSRVDARDSLGELYRESRRSRADFASPGTDSAAARSQAKAGVVRKNRAGAGPAYSREGGAAEPQRTEGPSQSNRPPESKAKPCKYAFL